jgi:hypothetical protein
MRLAGVSTVRGFDDLLTLEYERVDGSCLALTQRLGRGRCLEEEVAATGDDHVVVRGRTRSYVLFSGVYLTEPIDGRHWHRTRRRLAWDDGDVIVDVEFLVATKRSFKQVMKLAELVEPVGGGVEGKGPTPRG